MNAIIFWIFLMTFVSIEGKHTGPTRDSILTKEQHSTDKRSFSTKNYLQNIYRSPEKAYEQQYLQWAGRNSQNEELESRQAPSNRQELESPATSFNAVFKGLKRISRRTLDLVDQDGKLFGLTVQSIIILALTYVGGLMAFGGVALLPGTCIGVTCGSSGDRCVKGVCMCGFNPKCTGNADRCTNSVCMCGEATACALPIGNRCDAGFCSCGNTGTHCVTGSTTPSCLEPLAGSPDPIGTSLTATCQCSGISCILGTGGLQTQPFCGNAASAAATFATVKIGECGKCQVSMRGGGGTNTCDRTLDNSPNSASGAATCPVGSTSCGFGIGKPTAGGTGGPICCIGGECSVRGGGNNQAVRCLNL